MSEKTAATENANSSGKQPRGEVAVDIERCKGCGYCVEFCPLGVLVMAPEFNSKGYHYPQVEHPEKCSGCGLCGMYCPDFGIWGRRIPKQEKE